ncbi:3'-5' exonuclease [Streptomyces canus]|uniref:3'-5' exonuclease n=1 Tax=Streptomyces canus TaxID=58343 RepID=UPI00224FB135|nr:3'-5' exonuclease [Streptomyces canus]MCX4856654.1 AAA family ATPase [Streptomyces canus]
MRLLTHVEATPEQMRILADTRPGFHLVRGAAGSGKTTTALLRLRQLCATRLSRRERLQVDEPVRVLVLTYNKTLQGYVAELARQQVQGAAGLILRVATFGKWAVDMVGNDGLVDRERTVPTIRRLAAQLPLPTEFLIEEVEYLAGRFRADDLDAYISARREGRGQSPRVDRALRKRILSEVVEPYEAIKIERGWKDWNDLALEVQKAPFQPSWDVVIIDEAQDFSANQVRAVSAHLSADHSTTFVMDATQRIYPRFFTWAEAGVDLTNTYVLRSNHRNTRQIAALARGLVEGLPTEDDGALPDFSACDREGALPAVAVGRFSDQVGYAIHKLRSDVDLTSESVAFLHPKGGGWFDYLRTRLAAEGIEWCELTRASGWPTGPEAVALCTVHSAKGLEFDHVFMLGLNQQVTPHGNEEGDGTLDMLRRLLAMGVGRARKTVTFGYKADDPSTLIDLLAEGTYEEVEL